MVNDFQSSQLLPHYSLNEQLYRYSWHVFPNWWVFGISIDCSNMEGFGIPFPGCVACVNELDASRDGGGEGH